MNGRVYYNEFEPRTAAWLRQLIADGHLPVGDVDERSIEDVVPSDLRGYRQCHFFAGIGGWAYALALAGWPADRSVWTGSCPCQPFSAAGAGAGFADERHLWPAWFHLIAQCRPAVVFGEQVASTAGLGWLDLVCADLEAQDYAVGASDLCAAGVGAPHIRQRLWFVAHARRETRRRAPRQPIELSRDEAIRSGAQEPGRRGRASDAVGLADGDRERLTGRQEPYSGALKSDEQAPRRGDAGRCGELGNSDCERETSQSSIPGRAVAGTARGAWSAVEWISFRDHKWRPVEPGVAPLAHGLPARVVRLRGYGNAIVPQVAAEFIAAAVEAWELLT